MTEMTQAEVDETMALAVEIDDHRPVEGDGAWSPWEKRLSRAVRHLAARQMPALRWVDDRCYLGPFVVGFHSSFVEGTNGHGQILRHSRAAVEAAVRKELGVGQ